MFADADLIGIPYRLVIGEKSLKDHQLEYKARDEQDSQSIDLSKAADFISKLVNDSRHNS